MASLRVAVFEVAALVAAASAWGCADPVHDAKIAALGAEDPAVPVGPLHRPGQPCVDCHAPGGNAEPYTVAGTVYFDDKSTRPAPGVEVVLVDARGGSYKSVTNCAGNFFVRPDEFLPQYPFWVSLRLGDHRIDMESPVYREGSCAGCHQQPASRSSAGHVFLVDDPALMLELPACGGSR